MDFCPSSSFFDINFVSCWWRQPQWRGPTSHSTTTAPLTAALFAPAHCHRQPFGESTGKCPAFVRYPISLPLRSFSWRGDVIFPKRGRMTTMLGGICISAAPSSCEGGVNKEEFLLALCPPTTKREKFPFAPRPPPAKGEQRWMNFYWRRAVLLQKGTKLVGVFIDAAPSSCKGGEFLFVLRPPPAKGDNFLLAPRPRPAKGLEFLLAPRKGGEVYLALRPLSAKEGDRGGGGLLVLRHPPAKRDKSNCRRALLLRRGSKGGGVSLGKPFSVLSIETFSCFLRRALVLQRGRSFYWLLAKGEKGLWAPCPPPVKDGNWKYFPIGRSFY